LYRIEKERLLNSNGEERTVNLKTIFELLKETFSEWSEDKASRLAAALAYYTIFSLAPLLVIAVAIAGFFFGGREAAREQIIAQVEGMVGAQGAQAVGSLIENASRPGAGILATVIGVVTLLFGASGVFVQLHDALNTMWEVAPKPGGGFVKMIKDRFLSFTMILGTGFLLLVSLVVSAALTAINSYFSELLPGADILWRAINLFISIGVITLIFAAIYKVLPDVEVKWQDVWIGALVTSLLFNLGKYLISLYLSQSTVNSTFGAAGSLAVLLIWVYYSAQIVFFGAEFTQVYARRYGSRIQPDEDAIRLTEAARAAQGIPHQESLDAAARRQEDVAHRPPVTVTAATPTKSSLPGVLVFSVVLGVMLALELILGRRSPHKM
jgi:membrane protein